MERLSGVGIRGAGGDTRAGDEARYPTSGGWTAVGGSRLRPGQLGCRPLSNHRSQRGAEGRRAAHGRTEPGPRRGRRTRDSGHRPALVAVRGGRSRDHPPAARSTVPDQNHRPDPAVPRRTSRRTSRFRRDRSGRLLVDGAPWRQAVCPHLGHRFQQVAHGNRTAAARIFTELERRTPSFADRFRPVQSGTAET